VRRQARHIPEPSAPFRRCRQTPLVFSRGFFLCSAHSAPVPGQLFPELPPLVNLSSKIPHKKKLSAAHRRFHFTEPISNSQHRNSYDSLNKSDTLHHFGDEEKAQTYAAPFSLLFI
jgi:hypothetical protein